MNTGKQAASKKEKCPHCGKKIRLRGLKNHIRLLHKPEVMEQVMEAVIDQVMTGSHDSVSKSEKQPQVINQVVTSVSGASHEQVSGEIWWEVTNQLDKTVKKFSSYKATFDYLISHPQSVHHTVLMKNSRA